MAYMKINEAGVVTTMNTDDYLHLILAGGDNKKITLEHLKAAFLDGVSLNAMLDGVFIMYHRKSDNFPLMVKPHKWTSIQASGEVADGVAIMEGGKVLVVAPTEASTTLYWSSAAVNGGGATTTDRVTAMTDWEGKANTASQVSKGATTNTGNYAPGFCNLYSNGGLGAGGWWLPSLGEVLMIFASLTKVNYALSLIKGAAKISETAYWTSTEGSSTYAWTLFLNDGRMTYISTKSTNALRVRPVSTFIA